MPEAVKGKSFKVEFNNDVAYKVPFSPKAEIDKYGPGAPKGPANDFRITYSKGVAGGKWGGLGIDMGVWTHSQLNNFAGSKVRWEIGGAYVNKDLLNLFASVRCYVGFVPTNLDTSMIAPTVALGIKPTIYKDFGIKTYVFAVPHEKYYNAGINSASFYILAVEPFVKLGDDLLLKGIAQVWRLDTDKTEPILYGQFGAGLNWTF